MRIRSELDGKGHRWISFVSIDLVKDTGACSLLLAFVCVLCYWVYFRLIGVKLTIYAGTHDMGYHWLFIQASDYDCGKKRL